MTFSEALTALKLGKTIYRECNPRDKYKLKKYKSGITEIQTITPNATYSWRLDHELILADDWQILD